MIFMNSPALTGKDSISILTFLTDYKYACNSLGLGEGMGLMFMRHYLSGEPQDSFLAELGAACSAIVLQVLFGNAPCRETNFVFI